MIVSSFSSYFLIGLIFGLANLLNATNGATNGDGDIWKGYLYGSIFILLAWPVVAILYLMVLARSIKTYFFK